VETLQNTRYQKTEQGNRLFELKSAAEYQLILHFRRLLKKVAFGPVNSELSTVP
jgi:hypothetical protein